MAKAPVRSAQQPREKKILIASDGNISDIYAGALAHGFRQLGQTVAEFTWKEFFHNYPYADRYPVDTRTLWGKLRSVYYRAQNKFLAGPAVWALNRALVQRCVQEQPDLLFIYRGTHVWPATLRRLRRTLPQMQIFGYNNDDPFSPVYPFYIWRHYLRGLPFYDHVSAFRAHNLDDYRQRGITRVSLLRSYYRSDQHFPLPLAERKKAPQAEVIFIGHYAPDGRDAVLKQLLEAGVDLKIHGTGWAASPLNGYFTEKLKGPIKPLFGAGYNAAINGAQIALVFLSKLNRDTYTQRCFEIPATGTLMLAEYTDDLAHNLFAENVEACYFRNPDDLLRQVRALLAEPARLKKIAAAGHARLLRDHHEVSDRARQILAVLDATP